jgi:chromosome segregation protein
MRVEKIKLAGFKSFVDPTTVPVPSNLVAIVGPNGCGKSNVIDAVRWVMGESSAKMLRGESMADVIFNGSTSRKPVGAATIELVFDNTDGSAGGQYAQYNQISVKRQVSRDGQSSYFLNGVRCRRRDITDLFLGTGLGPRSYSLIEQGMISRLIEARPEDLRTFLEEAAGISKYKERRRETENRMARTRENLDRLTDLRDEVAKQLRHLQRQATLAEKYQGLKAQERRRKAELMALRWQGLDCDLRAREQHIAELEIELEAALAQQRRLEAGIERDRERHQDANDAFNEVQGRFYAVGAEIARLEQSIQYARDAMHRHHRDLEQAEKAWGELDEHCREDAQRFEQVGERLAADIPALEDARETEELAVERRERAEQDMHEWQVEWERFNQEAAEPAQKAQVERTRINHLEHQEHDLRRRLQRVEDERQRLDTGRLTEEIGQLELQEVELGQGMVGLQEQLEQLLKGIRESRDADTQWAVSLDGLRAELQAGKGRLASLEALQQAALGEQQHPGASEWLASRQLERAARLAQQLEVRPRWERAVEVVLGYHLQSICVDGLEPLMVTLESLDGASLGLFESSRTPQSLSTMEAGLLAEVQGPPGVRALLAGIGVAEDLEQALGRRPDLQPGESLVTPDGVWVGYNWLRLPGDGDASKGVLAREVELKELRRRVEHGNKEVEVLAARLQRGREALREREHAREELQRRLNAEGRRLAELRSALSGKRTRAEHFLQRGEHLEADIAELQQRLESDREEIELARECLHQALERMEALASQRESLVARRDGLREVVRGLAEEVRQRRADSHQIALRIESMRSSEVSLQQSLERIGAQRQQLMQRREELAALIEESVEPLEEQRRALERQLAVRVGVETELAQARNVMEELDAALREREQQRHQAEQRVEDQRAGLDQERMGRQEVLIRAKTVEEQLRETGLERSELLLELPPDASTDEWQGQLDKLAVAIQRLGAINLAAIDEYQEQSERMEYLDAQYADVSEALETLENAIRKIDRETRTRFKEVFDQVNSGLQAMFPRLFGGGHAYLELTGEDLLDTGVLVMARPPGKRNSSIHLLSGGEKALTAVALVFSIFELNPAPFCMLDEVDAPLDDANVGRFCELLKSMSERVQFIFITHNKGTMEIADHLTGVTMHEPGVSRLVSVDVEEAAQLAAV